MSSEVVFPLPNVQTTVLVTIALYNCFELLIIVLRTFKSFRGLYFWSYLLSTLGVGVYTIGFMLKTYRLTTRWPVFVTVIVIGWIPMVSGQAMVMYSKLHYLVKRPETLRILFAMIIVNGTIGHIPIIAMIYGASSGNPIPYVQPLLFYSKIQVTIFFLQSVAISGMYIFHSVKLLREDSGIHTMRFLHLYKELIILNIILILIDISILGLVWSSPSAVSAVYKSVAYGIKLKLEYSILNQLDDDFLPQPSIASEVEFDREAHPVPVIPTTFYGKTKIMDADALERCDTYVASGGICPNADYPAGEAFRSHLNDALTVISARTRRSSIRHWTDAISEDGDDFESFYTRSRRTPTLDDRLAWDIQSGLSPAPRSRMGSI